MVWVNINPDHNSRSWSTVFVTNNRPNPWILHISTNCQGMCQWTWKYHRKSRKLHGKLRKYHQNLPFYHDSIQNRWMWWLSEICELTIWLHWMSGMVTHVAFPHKWSCTSCRLNETKSILRGKRGPSMKRHVCMSGDGKNADAMTSTLFQWMTPSQSTH